MLLTACFRDYFCACGLETMKIYLACWEDMMVLFHLLAACCFDLHAAHTRDVLHNCFRMRNLSPATFILKQRFPFSIVISQSPHFDDASCVLSFFLFFLGGAIFFHLSGAGKGVHSERKQTTSVIARSQLRRL